MKKLNFEKLENTEVLTKSQMKNVFGGMNSIGHSCLCDLELNGQIVLGGWWCPDTLYGTVTSSECVTNCNNKYVPQGYVVVGSSTSFNYC